MAGDVNGGDVVVCVVRRLVLVVLRGWFQGPACIMVIKAWDPGRQTGLEIGTPTSLYRELATTSSQACVAVKLALCLSMRGNTVGATVGQLC